MRVAELRSGHQTTIRVLWNEIDPVYDQLAGLATSILVSSLNSQIIEAAAEEGIAFAEGELGPAAADISAGGHRPADDARRRRTSRRPNPTS